jgi:hypothetical protein
LDKKSRRPVPAGFWFYSLDLLELSALVAEPPELSVELVLLALSDFFALSGLSDVLALPEFSDALALPFVSLLSAFNERFWPDGDL